MTNDVRSVEPADPAAAAFSRLEREIALIRRAVENLATEKANIDIPDYSSTLGEMAQDSMPRRGRWLPSPHNRQWR